MSMKLILVVTIIIVLLVILNHSKARLSDKQNDMRPSKFCNDSNSCPTWFSCNATEKKCQCESGHDIVLCDNNRMLSAVPVCHCVTVDPNNGDIFAGACVYSCGGFGHRSRIYRLLPQHLNATNFPICSSLHRTGILCGDCENNRKFPVLSYSLTCIDCPNAGKNWWKFFLYGYGPLTLFYLFVLLFNINVTSSHLHGVVLFSQFISMPQYARVFILVLQDYHPLFATVTKFTLPLYSIWNLDVVRSLFPHICLNVNTLQALALEYSIALYPLFLIFVSYVSIALHDYKVPLVVYCWRPFSILCGKIRKKWDIRTSVIDSFATFFLLSYVKILSATFDILVFSRVYKLNFNSVETSYRLFYNPSVVFFGKEHLPYAITALIVSFIFTVIPTMILIAYTFQCFHKFLSSFKIQLYFLHTFVDTFQGCFKDGTEPGTYDCRWFSVVRLLIRVACFILYALTFGSMYFVYATVTFIMIAILFIIVQPFKKATVKYPITDTVFILLLALNYVFNAGYNVGIMRGYRFLSMKVVMLGFISGYFPLVYIIFLMLHWFVIKIGLFKGGLWFLKGK